MHICNVNNRCVCRRASVDRMLEREREGRRELFSFLSQLCIFTRFVLILTYSIFYSLSLYFILKQHPNVGSLAISLTVASVSTKSFRGCLTVLRPVERKRGSTWSRLPDFTPGYTLFSGPRYFFPPPSSCLSGGPGRHSIRSTIVREKAQLSRNIFVLGRRVRGAKKERKEKRKTRSKEKEREGESGGKREHQRLCSEMISPLFLVDEILELVNR